MCGLLAIGAKSFTNERLDFYRTLLYLTGLRGKDGTGTCSFRLKPKKKGFKITFTLAKSASAVSEFIDDNGVPARATALDFLHIAHCRAATRGAVSDENCHPFNFEKIVGMHNGTLTGFYNSDHSDSWHLFKDLNDGGMDKAIDTIGYGAAAIIFVDKEKRKLHCYRNSQRPLAMAILQKGEMLVLASEAGMLQYAAHRSLGEQVKPVDIETGKLYTWDLPFPEHIPEPKIETMKEYTYQSSGYYGTGGWSGNRGTTGSYGRTMGNWADDPALGEEVDPWEDQIPFGAAGQTTNEKGASNKNGEKLNKSGEQLLIEHRQARGSTGSVPGIPLNGRGEGDDTSVIVGGEWITMEKIKKMLRTGCQCCKAKPDIADLDTDTCDNMAIWEVSSTGNYEFICSDCMKQPPLELSNAIADSYQ